MTKAIVETAIRDLPAQFPIDELFERLIFIEHVEAGLNDIHEGKTIALDEVKHIIDTWGK